MEMESKQKFTSLEMFWTKSSFFWFIAFRIFSIHSFHCLILSMSGKSEQKKAQKQMKFNCLVHLLLILILYPVENVEF